MSKLYVYIENMAFGLQMVDIDSGKPVKRMMVGEFIAHRVFRSRSPLNIACERCYLVADVDEAKNRLQANLIKTGLFTKDGDSDWLFAVAGHDAFLALCDAFMGFDARTFNTWLAESVPFRYVRRGWDRYVDAKAGQRACSMQQQSSVQMLKIAVTHVVDDDDDDAIGVDRTGVRSVKFATGRFGKKHGVCQFDNEVTVGDAILAAEAYLSEPMTEQYYQSLDGDTYSPEATRPKYMQVRGDALGDCFFLEIADLSDSGCLELTCGS